MSIEAEPKNPKKQDAGGKGGKSTLKRHGPDYFREIGLKGRVEQRRKYAARSKVTVVKLSRSDKKTQALLLEARRLGFLDGDDE